MMHGVRFANVWLVLSVVSTGCASVEWTEELFAKRTLQVDERFLKVETNVREQGDRIDEVGGRIDKVEVRVLQLDDRLTETRDLIRNVGKQATIASVTDASTPEARSPRPTSDEVSGVSRTLIAVVHVPFGFDRASLDPVANAALAEILKELRENPRLTIDLEGSTDSVGPLAYNIRLSRRRVETVKRWLLRHGVERTRILGSAARGPLAEPSVKAAAKRRVMVRFMSQSE